MSKKMSGTICGIIMIVCGVICVIGYSVGNSDIPWWLLVFAGGIISAIISLIGSYQREKDSGKKRKALIGCISASISMTSVFIFLALTMMTNINNCWIILLVGGAISAIVSMLDSAKNDSK